eukprot:552991-Pyramimonas_sp.AAC.1
MLPASIVDYLRCLEELHFVVFVAIGPDLPQLLEEPILGNTDDADALMPNAQQYLEGELVCELNPSLVTPMMRMHGCRMLSSIQRGS